MVRFAEAGDRVSLVAGVSVNVCDRQGRAFPGQVLEGASAPLGLTRDGRHWLRAEPVRDTDRTRITVAPNLLPRGDAKLWGPAEAAFDHPGPVQRLAHGGNDVVVSLSETGVLRRWKTGAAKPAWEAQVGKEGQPFRPADAVLAVSPDGRLIAAGVGGEVRPHDATAGGSAP